MRYRVSSMLVAQRRVPADAVALRRYPRSQALARGLAEMYFFEILVRIHRAGEGELYTGIKPAGRDLGPAIPAADKAIADGKLEPLYIILIDKIRVGLHERFK